MPFADQRPCSSTILLESGSADPVSVLAITQLRLLDPTTQAVGSRQRFMGGSTVQGFACNPARGQVPRGCHIDKNRQAAVVIEVPQLADFDESLYPRLRGHPGSAVPGDATGSCPPPGNHQGQP